MLPKGSLLATFAHNHLITKLMTHAEYVNPSYFPILGWVIKVKNLHKMLPRGSLLINLALIM